MLGGVAREAGRDHAHAHAVLTDLNLRHNQIRDEGAAAIAEALRGIGVLTHLYLAGNQIRDQGAAAIAEALPAATGY